ncbi:MAG: Colicin production protein [Pseudomonadota bacterium]
MVLDVAVLAIIALSVLRGWWRGLLAQLLGLGGLVAVWLLAPRLVAPIRLWLLAHGQPAGMFVEGVSLLLAVGTVLGAAWLLATIIPDAVRRWSESAGDADRAFGAALGGVRGVLFAAMLLATVAWAEPVLSQQIPSLREPLRDSHAVTAARTWNIWRLVDPDRLESLRKALAARATWPSDLSPMTLSILRDPSLQRAAVVRDHRTLLADPRVVAVIIEGELADEFERLDAETEPEPEPEPAHNPEVGGGEAEGVDAPSP